MMADAKVMSVMPRRRVGDRHRVEYLRVIKIYEDELSKMGGILVMADMREDEEIINRYKSQGVRFLLVAKLKKERNAKE